MLLENKAHLSYDVTSRTFEVFPSPVETVYDYILDTDKTSSFEKSFVTLPKSKILIGACLNVIDRCTQETLPGALYFFVQDMAEEHTLRKNCVPMSVYVDGLLLTIKDVGIELADSHDKKFIEHYIKAYLLSIIHMCLQAVNLEPALDDGIDDITSDVADDLLTYLKLNDDYLEDLDGSWISEAFK